MIMTFLVLYGYGAKCAKIGYPSKKFKEAIEHRGPPNPAGKVEHMTQSCIRLGLTC